MTNCRAFVAHLTTALYSYLNNLWNCSSIAVAVLGNSVEVTLIKHLFNVVHELVLLLF